MFEKFRFRDAMLGLWKYKILIIITAILAAGFASVKTQRAVPNSKKDEECLVIGYFDIVRGEHYYVKDEIEIFANYCLAQLKSDLCLDHVFKNVEEKGLLNKITKEPNIDKRVLNDLVKIKFSEDSSSVINVYVLSDDEFVSTEIMNGYKSYFDKFILADKNIKKDNFIGMTKSWTTESLDNIEMGVFEKNESGNSLNKLLKQIILWEFLMLAIVVIAIFTKVLFVPTMNNKNDFSQYDVPVLFEMNGFGRNCNV